MGEPKTIYQILQKALAAEIAARDFYGREADQCRVDLVRDLLEKLRDEESGHAIRIKDMIAKMEMGRDVV